MFVTAPYLELRPGPGRGYPGLHVVARDESVDVLKRRTDWFKVRTERGVEGWAAQQRHAADRARGRLAVHLQPRRPRRLHLARWEIGIFARRLQRRHADLGLWLVLVQLAAGGGALRRPVPRQRLERHDGRPRPHARVRAGMAALAVRHAGHGHRAHRAEGARSCAPLDRTDQTAYVGGGRRASISPGAFSCAPSTRATSSSRAATTTRRWTNGNWASRSSSDASRAWRSAAAPRCALARPRRAAARGARADRGAGRAGRRPTTHAAARHRARSGAPQDQGAEDRQRELGDRRRTSASLSIEDFGTNPVYGVHRRLPRDRRLLLPGEVGPLHGRHAPASRRSAATSSCLPAMRGSFTYYNLALGYNFLPGEVFLGRGLAMTSGLYLFGGHRQHRVRRRRPASR